jgi:hypothetical protein
VENNFLKALKNETNIGVTANGAIVNATTNSYIVDYFATFGAMRNSSDEDVVSTFNKAFCENPEYAIKLLFYFRDIRGGVGERRIFKIILQLLAKNHPEIIKNNLEIIPEFGRWDDLFCLLGTPLEEDVIKLITTQLEKDLKSDNPSLLAKWMPSINTSSKNTRKLAFKFMKKLGYNAKTYRKVLSKIREKLDLVETKITKKKYKKIDYSKIPSKAGLKYKTAFYRNDLEKYTEFIKAVNNGEVKINAKTLFPYEIVKKALFGNYQDEELALNAFWKNLPDYGNENNINAIAVVDTSGSMEGCNYLPITSAIALGIYFAERNKGPYANHFISFSSRPQLIEIIGSNIVEKAKNIYDKSLVDNTNIEAVFDLLLNTAIKNNTPQSDMPERVVVISDMQFDCQICGEDDTVKLFDSIKTKWAKTGYKYPKLIFWNVNATPATFPMTIDDAGVQFVSGHSPVIFESVLTDKFLSPMEIITNIVTKERYANIKI